MIRSAVNVARSGAIASSAVGTVSSARLIDDAEPAIDPVAEEGDGEPGDRHAERAGVDRNAHRRGAHPVGLHQRRQDRLRREQVDDGQEGDQPDHYIARQRRRHERRCADRTGLAGVRPYRTWHVLLRIWVKAWPGQGEGGGTPATQEPDPQIAGRLHHVLVARCRGTDRTTEAPPAAASCSSTSATYPASPRPPRRRDARSAPRRCCGIRRWRRRRCR